MSECPAISWGHRGLTAGVLLARLLVGGLYIYMGLNKALHPVEFLKLVRQYEMVNTPLLLNLIAAGLPWFEVICGLLLLGGVAVRGAALWSVAMLLPFTTIVFQRALAIQAANPQPFCAIRFDCGCGAGEVFICYKLVENGLLILGSLVLLMRASPWCLRDPLFRARPVLESGVLPADSLPHARS
jgi:uncharacterized membrane protein YphA (DoxX/SURF4 family)